MPWRDFKPDFIMLQILSILSSFFVLSVECNGPLYKENETFSQFLERATILSDHLMENYRAELPAVYTRALDRYEIGENKQRFKVTLMYSKLLNINEPEHSATMLVEVYLHWTDMRLMWDPKKFFGIKALLLNQRRIFVPDIMPIDLINYRPNVDMDRQNALVSYNGSVLYFVSAVITFNCEIESWAFPFDTQECRLRIASRNFLEKEVSLNLEIFERTTLAEMSNGEWEAIEVRSEKGPGLHDMYGWEYPVASLIFRVKRNSSYYVHAMIIPSFMLTVLVMFGIFWSPVNEDNYIERLSLGFAAKLAMLMILEITAEHLPRSKEVPILAFYVLGSLFLIGTAIAAALVQAKFLRSTDIIVRKRDDVRLELHPSKKRRLSSCGAHTVCLMFFCLLSLANLLFLLFRGQSQ